MLSMKYLLNILGGLFILSHIAAGQGGTINNLKEEATQTAGVDRLIKTTGVQEKSAAQERMAYVKAKNIEKKEAIKASIRNGEMVVVKAKDKIALAKVTLSKKKKEKKISEREYVIRMARIDMIESKAKALENMLIRNQ